MLAVFVRAVLRVERRRTREQGIEGRGGAVTAIQRCGSALNTNVHFHSLVAEGVFEEQSGGSQRFIPALLPPTDVEVARLLASVRRCIVRLVRRHGIDLDGTLDDGRTTDRLSLEAPVQACRSIRRAHCRRPGRDPDRAAAVAAVPAGRAGRMPDRRGGGRASLISRRRPRAPCAAARCCRRGRSCGR
ncbi:MAG: transposase [Mycobacterium sp.]